MKKLFCSLLLFVLGGSVLPGFSSEIILDENIPAYSRVDSLSGEITVRGSNTVLPLMNRWAEAFRAMYPDVRFDIEGQGSGTAPPALLNGTADIGMMSRNLRPNEEEAFMETQGELPLGLSVGIDALAIVVNQANPIEGLSMADLDAIFSSTYYNSSYSARVWGQLGMEGAWRGERIRPYGRTPQSGTFNFLKVFVFYGGDYNPRVQQFVETDDIIAAVSRDTNGVGYAGVAYVDDSVKVAKIQSTFDDEYYLPSHRNCLDNRYELARSLRLFVTRTNIDPLTREFLRFTLSREGQQIVKEVGYYPVDAETDAEARQLLERG